MKRLSILAAVVALCSALAFPLPAAAGGHPEDVLVKAGYVAENAVIGLADGLKAWSTEAGKVAKVKPIMLPIMIPGRFVVTGLSVGAVNVLLRYGAVAGDIVSGAVDVATLPFGGPFGPLGGKNLLPPVHAAPEPYKLPF